MLSVIVLIYLIVGGLSIWGASWLGQREEDTEYSQNYGEIAELGWTGISIAHLCVWIGYLIFQPEKSLGEWAIIYLLGNLFICAIFFFFISRENAVTIMRELFNFEALLELIESPSDQIFVAGALILVVATVILTPLIQLGMLIAKVNTMRRYIYG